MTDEQLKELDAELQQIYEYWLDSEEPMTSLFRSIYILGKHDGKINAAGASIADTAGAKLVAYIAGADEYGPKLLWKTHWVELIGQSLYLAATPAISAADAKCLCSGLGPCEKLSNCRKASSVADPAYEADIQEAREILTSLISNIETDGHYSAESTIGFIRQALLCLAKSDWPDDGAEDMSAEYLAAQRAAKEPQ